MLQKSLPFSLEELRRKVLELDVFVKSAALAVMNEKMGPDDLGFPSTVVDELAHLHGLLDLATCCVEEIEPARKVFPPPFERFESLPDEDCPR